MAASHRILVMRHPETVANVGHYLSGRMDVDLTEAGVRQMYRAIDALVAWRPDRIWTSPLSRCQAIGEEAAHALGVSCTVVPDLQELEFGSAQGMTLSELLDGGYDFPWDFDDRGRSLPAPGAESFEDLLARAGRVLDLLRPLEGRTACVTHGGLSRALLGAAFQVPPRTFWNLRLPNVSSQVMTCDGRTFTLCALGLAPEEVMARMSHPELAGRDVADSFRK